MILNSARLAIAQLFSREFRRILWKSIGWTIALLFGLWFALDTVFSIFILPMIGPGLWLTTIFSWLFGAGLVFGLVYLIAPATSLFAGFFVDQIADRVEDRYYPDDKPGTALSAGDAAMLSIRFTLLVIATNILAFMLLLVPGVNLVILLVANGYLLGREYFQFVSRRFLTANASEQMRRQNKGRIFTAGLLIAAFMLVPLVNLLTPLFAAAFMSHVFKHLQKRSNQSG